MAGTTEGMDPAMAEIVNRIVRESGGKVWIVSGFRSYDQQVALYQKYLNGTGNLAAKPGTSMHEHGTAVDFGGDLRLAAELAAKYGLTRSVPGEPWHFTLGGEGQRSGGSTTVAASTSTHNHAAVGGLPPNASPEQIEAYIRENYPQAAGFLDIPEIRGILIEAARGQWTPTKLEGAIQATNWWRTNSEASRNYWALKGADPAQLKALIDAKLAELEPMLQQLGLGGDHRVFAEWAIQYGWTPDEVREKLATHLQGISDKTGVVEGSSTDLTADDLMRMARSEYLVPISRMDAERWAIDIFAGRKTEEQVRSLLARQAEARFPGMAEQGVTPGDYMAPIRNVIAETLELNPADVDLLDRRWSAVLEQGGTDGKLRPMTIAEAQSWARSQQEYRYTKGAQGEAAGMAETLGRMFGAVA